MLNHSL